MKPIIFIEYCTSWGYVDKAVGLAANILKMHKNNITSVNIMPSDGGVFEVSMDEEKIFSKKELNRFPEHLEVEKILSQQL